MSLINHLSADTQGAKCENETIQINTALFMTITSMCILTGPVITQQSKVHVKLSLDVQIHGFLTSALDGGEWSASRHYRITPPGE
jgi:hypothetical protein